MPHATSIGNLGMLAYLKEHEHEQKPVTELVSEAYAARVWLIVLVFLTNFAGFLSVLLETSSQAQFLSPHGLILAGRAVIGYGRKP